MDAYLQEYSSFLNDPELFWQEQAKALTWFKKPSRILAKDEHGADRWFVDGELNSCYLAIDVHVENGRGEQTALIYDSPVTATKQQFTYLQMQDEVSRLAGAMQSLGLQKGDIALIYMPMIPQAVFAMLACARLGVIHSVVFGGFAAHELAARIDGTQAKLVLTASCGIEPSRTIAYKPLLDEAIRVAEHKPEQVLLYQRPELHAALDKPYEHDWLEAVTAATPCDCVPVLATDPLYILYTSGSTGKPKGVVRDNGGHAVAMKYSMRAVYDSKPGDVFWAASDVGWVVGHSYIVYAPLINGNTTILYEGKPVGTPDAGAFWRVVEEYKVNVLFSAPTAFRAIKKQDADALESNKYDLSSLQALYIAGERLDPATFAWLETHFNVPLIDHWWQTETSWAIAANLKGIELLPAKAGSAGVPVPGYQVHILDEDGNILSAGEQGYIAIKLPLPPACLTSLWQSPERFKAGYLEQFPGYYVSGDGGYIDEEGYVFVMGRMDDVINVAGHRLSTGRMEEVIGFHNDVAECAVIGVNDDLKGQLPLGFIILKDGASLDEAEANTQIKQMLRDEVGAINSMKHIYIVPQLPKTRSGKILRKVMRQIANGEDYAMPSTIDDASSLDIIENVLAQ
jgi:propionyl-CoA synthetase